MPDRDSESNGRHPGETIHRLAEVIELPIQPSSSEETAQELADAVSWSMVMDQKLEALLHNHLITFEQGTRANLMVVNLQGDDMRMVAIAEAGEPAAELYAVKDSRTYFAVIDRPEDAQQAGPESAERLIKLLSGVDNVEWSRLGSQETYDALRKLERLVPRLGA